MINEKTIHLFEVNKQVNQVLIDNSLTSYDICVVTASILVDAYSQAHTQNKYKAHDFIQKLLYMINQIESEQL